MFRGRTDAATFASAAGCVNALFVGITVGFPFLLYGLLSLSNCQRTGGACGALGLVLAIWIKPMIYVAYVFAFLGLSARRLSDAGLPTVLALGLIVLMLGDIQWSIVAGAPWSVAFATGFTGGFPRSLMAGLACIAALSMLPTMAPGTGGGADRRTLGAPALILLALLLVVAVSSLVTLLTSMFGGLLTWSRLLHSAPFSLIHTPAHFAVVATPLVVAALCYREWVGMGRPGAGSPWAAAVAVCVAIIAVGSVAGTVLDAWLALTQLLGLRGQWPTNVIFNWTALAELLALLVLPWLLRSMPSAPSPAREEPRPVPPAAVQA
jgi:uncharacterized membrane protein YhaH (DUF805 family)